MLFKNEKNDLYYSTDEYLDFVDNWNKFYSVFTSYKNGDKQELKWIIIYLYMVLQSIFILALKGPNSFNMILVISNGSSSSGFSDDNDRCLNIIIPPSF